MTSMNKEQGGETTTQAMVIVANDAGKLDTTTIPQEVVDKCVELVCHEKYENTPLSQVIVDMIDDVVDVWLDKLDEE